MANPYVEYTNSEGVKSKMEFNTETTQSNIEKFYTDHIKDHFDNAKSN